MTTTAPGKIRRYAQGLARIPRHNLRNNPLRQHTMKGLIVFFTLVIILSLAGNARAQPAAKNVAALRIAEPIIVDGKFTEGAWSNAAIASVFTQFSPNPGVPSAYKTEVKILYDNNAVYIGATMYDDHPDSILKQLCARDEFEYNNNDYFGVNFDTYHDLQNGFSFVVTAGGVQGDAKIKFDGMDYSWNAPWLSRAVINEKGWCVEMKIPYSALRFPKQDIQLWGVNFIRSVRRTREKSYWSKVLPNVAQALSQAGTLSGIDSIKSPLRLALLPYVSAYGENYDGTNAKTINGGLDIKYGINESFTLDMTLVPDFGQTLYDNRVLNLSPIEVRYNERRYFFTEGVDLFNKNDLFYSRRVGGTPVNINNLNQYTDSNEVVIKNPTTTKLYNATKISGRTRHNLGIGFFNAVAAPAYARVRDTISNEEHEIQSAPLTNYNVIVLEQALKNNSYLSLINTNVYRQENSYNAHVTALLFKVSNKANSLSLTGSGDVSRLYKSLAPDVGQRFYLAASKIRGNYISTLAVNSISDRFNPNDLGYLGRNNLVNYNYNNSYNIYKPFWIVNSQNNYINIAYTRVYNPSVFQSLTISGGNSATLRNFLSLGLYWTAQPRTINDYFEPRQQARVYLYPKNYSGGAFFSSDYRKKFALDGSFNYQEFNEQGRKTLYTELSPRYRFSDKLSMIYDIEATDAKNDVGFVNNINDSIYLGTRNVYTLTNSLSAAYIFNSTMSLKLDARHYWSQAKYSKYSYLDSQGYLQPSGYSRSHNVNFNSFNVYTSFVWQFKPGSEMSVVYQNSIYRSGADIYDNYFTNTRQVLQAPQSNSLSIKVIYFLDYISLRNSLNGRTSVM